MGKQSRPKSGTLRDRSATEPSHPRKGLQHFLCFKNLSTPCTKTDMDQSISSLVEKLDPKWPNWVMKSGILLSKFYTTALLFSDILEIGVVFSC